MTRRRNLPGADELFRSTGSAPTVGLPSPLEDASPGASGTSSEPVGAPTPPGSASVGRQTASLEPARVLRTPVRRTSTAGQRRPSGRERHEEKITVYVSAEELVDLEHARLALRADHGLAVDRGRIVREALAVVLADLEAKGEGSILVRRIRGG